MRSKSVESSQEYTDAIARFKPRFGDDNSLLICKFIAMASAERAHGKHERAAGIERAVIGYIKNYT